jgi:hypothetical protein
MKKRLVLGVDFDGTIVEEAFPNIGEIKQITVELMKEAMEAGHLVVVWTARSGQAEQQAKDFLIENDIPHHYVNENPEDPYAIRGEQGRKIFCDYYLDDRAVYVDDIEKVFNAIRGNKTPKRAILKRDVSIGELGTDEEDYYHFYQGMELEIVRELKSRVKGSRQFIVYSEELNESTVIYDGILELLY